MKTLEFEQLVERVTAKVMERLQVQRMTQKVILLGNNQSFISNETFNYLQKQQKSKKRKLVILTEISFENLVNSLQFHPQNETEKMIVEAIKAGDDFLIIKEGRTYLSLLKQGRYGLKQKIQEFEKQFHRYGAKFMALSELKEEPILNHCSPPYEILTDKKILTYHELLTLNLNPASTLELSSTVKLTDYAKDYLREQRINIRIIDEK
ncbi:hypothetical protein ACYSNW_03900 [Enterococcus sp. LJL99]